MNIELRYTPLNDLDRYINIYPEDVELFRSIDFITAYRNHCEEHGVNRRGDNPTFTWTVRPNLHLYVIGYALHEQS